MSIIDQCPSTTKGEKRKPSKAELAGTARTLGTTGGASGAKVWRSPDEYYDSPQFREFVDREFPAGAVDVSLSNAETRRDFLKVMGASLALAGAATIPGCRRPDHKILAYSKDVPEEIIPGKPLFYATSMQLPGGGAEGLLVETHEGRPTKIEGNPLHPNNQGKSSVWAQASVMGLYDPDRLKNPSYNNPSRGRLDATWDDFRAWAETNLAKYDQNAGEGVAIVTAKRSGPTFSSVKADVLKRWPKAVWVSYEALDNGAAIAGSAAAFGEPMRELLSLDKAKVVLSFDRDFLQTMSVGEPSVMSQARGFAHTRRVEHAEKPAGAEMSRLYVLESAYSITGGQADHRFRVAPSQIPAAAIAIAKRVAKAKGAQALADALAAVKLGEPDGMKASDLDAIAEDLVDGANAGRVAVLAGPTQPAYVHALCHALNSVLGAVGQTVKYLPMGKDEAADSAGQMKDLVARMGEGKVSALVCVGVNPAYDGPAGFGEAMKKVASTISLSVEQTETAAASMWSLNAAHYLESWGDTEAADGTIAPIQPMIAPLYEFAMSETEFLAMLASPDRGKAQIDGYELVRRVWKTQIGEANFEKAWRRALQDGVVAGTSRAGESAGLNVSGVVRAVAEGTANASATPPTKESLDVVFRVGHLADGRFANVAWLHELPEVGTRTVWDNPAMMSPRTARELGVTPDKTTARMPEGRMVSIEIADKKITIPAWIMPGMPDNTIALTLGYGRTACGLVGDGVGVDVGPIKPHGAMTARGAKLAPTGDDREISSTQNHWTMASRTSIVRTADLDAWKKHGDHMEKVAHQLYGTSAEINFAERLGELSHTPPNIALYDNPFNASKGEPAPGSRFSEGPQWGMTIDLSTCTGCGACTIACQSENNIPVVGKKEVAKGREMAWIRVDRYFTGEDLDEPGDMLHQPVACVHCENAPCETVCPVNATVHGPEGLNYMTYNRCIGTRYCANNCPYKVRRYNYFEWGKHKFNGDYYGREIIEKVAPERGGVNGSNAHNKININLIPPRLREKLDQIEQMQKNPDVTVRMRGVMEKCTYCVQRINAAKLECKLSDIKGQNGKVRVPDGFFQAACQQACPSESIVFGDILDPSSRVAKLRNGGRSYALLGYLLTRPRTSYLLRLRNPNPKIRKPEPDPFHHGGHEGGEGHAGEGHAFYEPKKRRDDAGYAMSLRVLGASNGVNA